MTTTPCAGPARSEKDCVSPVSTSAAPTLPKITVSWLVLTSTSFVVGASFTAATLTVTWALLLWATPSVATYEKSAVPLKFAFGAKVTVPFPFKTAVPPTPLVTEKMESGSLSASVSLPRRSEAWKVTGVSSVADNGPSSCATGASFTPTTLTVTVALLLCAEPSVALYVKLAAPLNSASGVKVTVPLPFKTAVPPKPLVTEKIDSDGPSTSVSLPRSCAAVNVTGVSSVADNGPSSCATGASFTAATLTVTVALLLCALPSVAL